MVRVTRTPITKEPLRKRLLLAYADKKLLSTRQDYNAIKEYFLARTEGLPRFVKRKLANRYTDIHNKREQKWANVWLRETTKTAVSILKSCPFADKKALKNDDLLKSYAKQNAALCLSIVSNAQDDEAEYTDKLIECYNAMTAYCNRWKIIAPYSHVEEKTPEHYECAILRLVCEQWWHRKLSRIQKHTNEHLLIALGEVKKGVSAYVSYQALNEWKAQQKANRAYLESMEIINIDTSETMPLDEIADATTANPEKRRIELMVRCRGLEELADDDNFQGLFLTLTAPSKYHAHSKKYNGCTPKQTQAYLVNLWAKVRAKLKRDEINYYGVRVVEPHHDATPHWHLLLFVNPAHKNDLLATCREYALKEDGSENGAQKHRFTVEEIDPEKGSATGYIAKYISKNINGAKMGDANNIDLEAETTAPEGASRATAWASRWNIRQFQFFGAASVTLYREFRRIDADSINCHHLENVRAAADSARWAEFTRELARASAKLSYTAGKPNKYGEAVVSIVGIVGDSVHIDTRLEKYALRKRGSAASWSTVNNCTLRGSEASELRKIGIPPELSGEFMRGAMVRVDEMYMYQIRNGQIRQFASF